MPRRCPGKSPTPRSTVHRDRRSAEKVSRRRRREHKKDVKARSGIFTSDHSFADLLEKYSGEDGEEYAPGLREELRRQETLSPAAKVIDVSLEEHTTISSSSSSSTCARCRGRRYVIDAVTHARRPCFECGPKTCEVCEGDRVLYDEENKPVVCSACEGRGTK